MSFSAVCHIGKLFLLSLKINNTYLQVRKQNDEMEEALLMGLPVSSREFPYLAPVPAVTGHAELTIDESEYDEVTVDIPRFIVNPLRRTARHAPSTPPGTPPTTPPRTPLTTPPTARVLPHARPTPEGW